MIRTLSIIAAVGFVLCFGCLAAAFAVAGGPFSIDDHWRFHHDTWSDDKDFDQSEVPATPKAPAPPRAPRGIS